MPARWACAARNCPRLARSRQRASRAYTSATSSSARTSSQWLSIASRVRLSVCVDALPRVVALGDVAARAGVHIDVFAEVNAGQRPCGVTRDDALLSLADAIAVQPRWASQVFRLATAARSISPTGRRARRLRALGQNARAFCMRT
ncbi:hypothetical protein BURKHO8Y_10354 [Burkholderia sp. 8Y]|nr:hypothetical protein BURKHO8Y_10354 [Burkholderia sp. 8Y]